MYRYILVASDPTTKGPVPTGSDLTGTTNFFFISVFGKLITGTCGHSDSKKRTHPLGRLP
jgi:hypothetical protein